MSSRRFTEKEAAAIMQQAAEAQAGKGGFHSSEGFSEAELQAAARELGIDASAVDSAIQQLTSSALPAKAGFWGGPYKQEIEVVTNGTMTDEKWEDILAECRGTFNESGTIDRRGNTYEWIGTGGGIDRNTLTIRESQGSVRIRINSSYGEAGVVGYLIAIIPIFITVAVVSKLKLEAVLAWTVLALVMSCLFLLARQWSLSIAKERSGKLSKLIDRTRNHVAAEGSQLNQLEISPSQPQTETISMLDQA